MMREKKKYGLMKGLDFCVESTVATSYKDAYKHFCMINDISYKSLVSQGFWVACME